MANDDFGRRLEKLVSYGILAPSADNSQPWRFKLLDSSIRIIHDRSRADFLYNVNDIASLVALGAVIENICIAAPAEGLECEVSYSDGKPDPQVIADLSVRESIVRTDPLFPFIGKRCVNRRRYDGRGLSAGVKEALASEGLSQPGVRVHVVDEARVMRDIARLVYKGDRILFENRELLSGLLPWIRWTRAEVTSKKDGMSLESLEINAVQKRLFRVIKYWPLLSFLNRLGFSTVAGMQSISLIRSASALFLITAPGRGRLDFLRGGRVLERVWLRAASLGLSVQPMTGITFLCSLLKLDKGRGLLDAQKIDAGRILEGLNSIFGLDDDTGLVVLCRLGYAPPPSDRSLRRPLEEVLS